MWLRGTPHVPVPQLCSGEHIQKFYHKINITLALLKLSGIYQIVRQSCMGSYDLYSSTATLNAALPRSKDEASCMVGINFNAK